MVRYINGWHPRSHVEVQEITEVGWLPFPKRVSFKLCHLFKVKMGQAPEYLARDFHPTSSIHSHSTRGSDPNYIPDYSNFSPDTFHYTVVREWNALPTSVKSQRILTVFKRELKRHLAN